MLREFRNLVGDSQYASILEMLKAIGPEGRTHRLSVFLGGVLQYALTKIEDEYEEGSLEEALVFVEEAPDGSTDKIDLLRELISQICSKAGIRNDRVSSKGDEYSLAAAAIYEYTHWYAMPWES